MTISKLFEDLQNNFGLKDKHILILKALQGQRQTAIELCRTTGIPRGRIYRLLNELLSFDIILKSKKTPTLYSMEDLPDRVLEYLKYNFDKFIANESEIISSLDRIEPKERIELIDDKLGFTFALAKFFSECKASGIKTVYQTGRHISLPFMIYPFDKLNFIRLRELITQKRPTVSHANIFYSLIVYKLYRELYDSGVKFIIILEKEALDYHISLIKKELGEKFLKDMLNDLLSRIKNRRMKVFVLDEYLATGTDISKNAVMLSLIHHGFVTAIKINSRKTAKVYLSMFDSMEERSIPLESYLNSKKLLAQN